MQTIEVPLPIPTPRAATGSGSAKESNRVRYEASAEEIERERKAAEKCGAEVVGASVIEQMVAVGEVFARESLTTPVRILSNPDPGYARRARRNDTSGIVRLRVVFSVDSRITHIEIVDRLPDDLTLKAIQAACGMRFIPALKDGQTVAQTAFVIYKFQIY